MKLPWIVLATAGAAATVAIPAAMMVACAAQPSAESSGSAAGAADDMAQEQQISYGVGYYLGEEVRTGLVRDGLEADYALLARGFVDALNERDPMLSREVLDDVLFAVHEEMQARTVRRLLEEDPEFRALHDRNLARSRAYHADYALKEGVVTLPGGVQYTVLAPGTGARPGPEDTVVIKLRGTLIDGTVINAGERIEFEIDTVTPGGQEVLQLMRVGAHWQGAIPPERGYGAAGDPPRVGPNETLVFEVELLEIK